MSVVDDYMRLSARVALAGQALCILHYRLSPADKKEIARRISDGTAIEQYRKLKALRDARRLIGINREDDAILSAQCMDLLETLSADEQYHIVNEYLSKNSRLHGMFDRLVEQIRLGKVLSFLIRWEADKGLVKMDLKSESVMPVLDYVLGDANISVSSG